MKITTAIMAHPQRREHVEWMMSKIGSVPVSWDNTGNVWGNARCAWQMMATDSTHHMVLQDDISMCADFMETVKHCVSLRPEDPMTFHHTRPTVLKALDVGFNWIAVKHYCGAQALVMPAQMAKEFLTWVHTHDDLHTMNPHAGDHSGAWDDINQYLFFRRTKKRLFAAVPLIVNHVGAQRSLLRNTHVCLNKYIGDDALAMKIPWDNLRAMEE